VEIKVKELTVVVGSNWRVDGDILGEITIHFEKSKEGPMVPHHCVFSKIQSKVGTKLNLEVAENGYIIINGKRKLVCDTHYQFEELIKKEIEEQVKCTKAFDPDNWPQDQYDFTNETITINAKYKQLEQKSSDK